MNREEVLAILGESGAMLEGHFELHSGLHSDRYFQSALVLQHPPMGEALCRALASLVGEWESQVVAGPALGGIVLAYELARQLGVRSIFAERADGVMRFRRQFAVERGERVLIAEDTITKGGSVMDVAELVEESGGVVAGMACLLDRSGGMRFSFPHRSLLELEIATYSAEECPLCEKGVPLETPGSGRLPDGG